MNFLSHLFRKPYKRSTELKKYLKANKDNLQAIEAVEIGHVEFQESGPFMIYWGGLTCLN